MRVDVRNEAAAATTLPPRDHRVLVWVKGHVRDADADLARAAEEEHAQHGLGREPLAQRERRRVPIKADVCAPLLQPDVVAHAREVELNGRDHKLARGPVKVALDLAILGPARALLRRFERGQVDDQHARRRVRAGLAGGARVAVAAAREPRADGDALHRWR